MVLAGTAVLLAGCQPPAALSAEEGTRQKKVCSPAGEDRPGESHVELPPSETVYRLTGERVIRVAIEGRRALPELVLREGMKMGEGTTLDAASLDRDVRALVALEVLSGVRVDVTPEAGGVAVTYHVTERPFVDRVFVAGDVPSETGTYFFPVPGDVHDPAAVRRSVNDLEARLVRLGHLDAAVGAHTHAAGDGHVDLCLAVDAGPAYRVRKLVFEGNHVLSAADLRATMDEGLEESDRGKLNTEGGLLRTDLLERSLLFVNAAAYDRGLVEWKTDPPALTRTRVSSAEGGVDILVRVHEGPVFHVLGVAFEGALAAPAATYRAFVDVEVGEVFSRKKILAIVERAGELHRKLGRVDLKVHPAMTMEGELVSVKLVVEAAVQ